MCDSDKDRLSESGSEYIPSESESSESDVRKETTPLVEALGDAMDITDDESEKGRTPRTRKRKCYLSKKEYRRKKRNSGKAYRTLKGKKVSEKIFSNLNCHCRMKCFDKVDEEDRKKTFENFWNIGVFSCQNAFLCGLIKQEKPKVRRPRDNSRQAKIAINQYYIPIGGNSVKVCKKYFLDTFQISDGRMTRAMKKVQTGEQPGADKRGSGTPANKIPEDKINKIREHISNFPMYQSHYTRAHNPNRKYLSSNLNIRLMYNLYQEDCKNKAIIPVKEAIYRRTFNSDFNLHFHVPSKDTCVKCDQYKILKTAPAVDKNEKRKLEVEHELHLWKAEAARQSMKREKEKSDRDSLYYVFTFDLEKALPFPTLTCSVAY
ncbi:uncharacterized protein LOC134529006 [Bacillus rossius redtenbacheri]|uniref:uncharacterized protein LOC134529006 n=1 Tax=Bacillus rossius redtenbacheri TaxID=93214 RepID=UPI002FDE2450